MDASAPSSLDAFFFKNRGALLALPALALVLFGVPTLRAALIGIPIAILGELLRMWAVGYSGVTTRGDHVEAPQLVTAGPYAYVRNPLYVGNFITALGFALAFTGDNSLALRLVLVLGSLIWMLVVYGIIVPHEERFLRATFGDAFARYCERVPRIVPRLVPAPEAAGTWDGSVIARAETRTFVTFVVMLAILVGKGLLHH
uniref:Isoprenylcysteine carboxyl methyltransferase (ICMT) family protein n=1 Tax=mine drainage metagenome TaxID=410659 RepID=E6Q550_9ZZZZ